MSTLSEKFMQLERSYIAVRQMKDDLKVYNEAMRTLLYDRMFWTAGRTVFDRQGYSLSIDENTAIRDINYRNAPLYDTALDALNAAIAEEINEMNKDTP